MTELMAAPPNVVDLVHDLSDGLETHPLYLWIASSAQTDALRGFDSFVPILGFVLTFPYYNRQYLAYPDEPGGGDGALAAIINEHAREDATHAALFLDDFRRGGFDRVWGLDTPSLLLWAVWVAPMLDPARAVESERIRALLEPADASPLFRYLHIEQIEHDGHLLFSAATRRAERVRAEGGVRLRYFGEHHLRQESGHVGGSEFERVALSGEQVRHAAGVVRHKHALSVAMNDVMYDFARRSAEVESPGVLFERERTGRLAHVRRRLAAYEAGALPEPEWTLRPDAAAEQTPLVAAWHRHHAAFAAHPFAALCEDARAPDEAEFVLRCAALLFAPRICSLHAFYRFDCRPDAAAQDPDAAPVRFVSSLFATEAEIFFHDWDVLDMDRRIPWDMATLLQWWFFDREYGRPELEALHEFRRAALGHPRDPVLDYWALMSVHFMSRAFFGSARLLAERCERADPGRGSLPYFSGVHHLLYEDADSAWQHPPHPTSLAHTPVTAAQRDAALGMMDAIAKFGRRQFDNVVRAVTVDREKFSFLRG